MPGEGQSFDGVSGVGSHTLPGGLGDPPLNPKRSVLSVWDTCVFRAHRSIDIHISPAFKPLKTAQA